MKLRISLFLLIVNMLFASCRMSTGGSAEPEEKGISILRYDKLLSDYIRSNSFSAMQKLNMEYRQPTKILIENVLAIGGVGDDSISQKLQKFYSDTTLLRLIADVEKMYPDLEKVEKELTCGFRKLKKEIPAIRVPLIYSQISAFNESIVLVDSLLGISLDKYMGEDYPFYKRFYYDYQRRTMRPDRIASDCFAFYLMGQYPFMSGEGSCLTDWMVHYGKINYVVQQLLGYNKVGDVLGYSEKEEKWCRANEKKVWKYLVENGYLYARDPMVIRKYMKPVSSVNLLGEPAPALIGTWLGTRIVSSYMKRHKDTTLQHLLENRDYRHILEESGYNK